MTISVRPSLFIFWLRSKLTVTDTMVNGTAPNTIFGLIPAGRNDISQPLNRVSRVQVSTKLSAGALLLAAIFAFLAVSTGSAVWWVLVLIAGVASYRARLVITDSGGGTQEVSVSPLDREAVQAFAALVNERLAARPA
jgi:hypothetical protein